MDCVAGRKQQRRFQSRGRTLIKRNWASVFLTRITIVGLVIVTVVMVSGSFFAGLTKRLLHESTGWTWNFTLEEVDFLAGKMVIKDLYLVPPEGSRKEALIADQARISVASWGLSNRQIVFDSVEIEGVRSSSLDRLMVMNLRQLWPTDLSGSTRPSPPIPSSTSGRIWLDSFQVSNPQQPALAAPELSRQILGEWETELAEQVGLFARAEKQLQILNESMADTSDNPLRQGAGRMETARQMKTVSEATIAAKDKFQYLVERRNNDLYRFMTIRENDLQRINAADQKTGLACDEKLTDASLIQTEYNRFSDHICEWSRSIRDTVIAEHEKTSSLPKGSGRNVVFTGSRQRPGIIVKRMDLDGAAKMGSDHVDFVVAIENLTDRVRLQTEPTKMQVRAQGRYHLLVSAEFQNDLTSVLRVTCPDFVIGSIPMGDADAVAVAATPGNVSFVATIDMSESSTHGTAEIEHRFGGIKLDSMHVLLSSQIDQRLLQAELEKVSGFNSKISFDWKNGETNTSVKSGPGRLFLAAISRCLLQTGGSKAEELKAQIETAKAELEQQTGSAIDICSSRLDVVFAQERELVAKAEATIRPSDSLKEIRR